MGMRPRQASDSSTGSDFSFKAPSLLGSGPGSCKSGILGSRPGNPSTGLLGDAPRQRNFSTKSDESSFSMQSLSKQSGYESDSASESDWSSASSVSGSRSLLGAHPYDREPKRGRALRGKGAKKQEQQPALDGPFKLPTVGLLGNKPATGALDLKARWLKENQIEPPSGHQSASRGLLETPSASNLNQNRGTRFGPQGPGCLPDFKIDHWQNWQADDDNVTDLPNSNKSSPNSLLGKRRAPEV